MAVLSKNMRKKLQALAVLKRYYPDRYEWQPHAISMLNYFKYLDEYFTIHSLIPKNATVDYLMNVINSRY